MDGGGSLQSPEEREAEKLMDDYLKAIGFHRKKIAKDGSCLFRAVAEQVLHSQSLHTTVRAKCVEFLKQNRQSYEAFIEGDFEDYLCKLQDPQQWVGEVEINALAVMYKRDFEIYQEPGKPAVNITDNNFKDKVRLCFLNGNHYDSVYPISHIKNAAFCQSILYELLYTGVFKVDRGIVGPYQRSSRTSNLLSDDTMNACASSDESELGADEPLWVENETSTTSTRHNNQSYRGRGRGRQLPERVKRSLNPTLLRNIEYDVWQKSKRAQQKMDYCIAAGMQYTVGDRCQVRLEGSGRSYNATIKELSPDNGPVTVYIEDLGNRQVPLWSVRPPSDENSWSTVVRDKRLSNGHGEWEERGKGRGRTKSTPAAPGSQVPAQGSSGRVQKQHSWPSQATGEEQGGPKTSRKSLGSVESAQFGLTEKERLAKEEEKRNVALVEIQLRDEQSFPALGAQLGFQGDGGRRKGGDKKKSQRNKMKSPVEDVRASSPSAGEQPKSSTPPLANTTAATTLTTSTTMPINPTLPAAKPPAAPSANSDSSPAQRSSVKASEPNVNMAGAAPAAKTNTQSYASAAGTATPLSSVPSSATIFPFRTPVLPAASSPPHSSSSPPPSSSAKHPPSSKSSEPPSPSSSVPPPTFIAPIAPSPITGLGFLPPSSLPRSSPPVSTLPHSPSPPSFSSVIHHAAHVQEAPPATAQSSLPSFGGPVEASQTFKSQTYPEKPAQASLHQIQPQSQVSQTQNTILMPQTEVQSSLPQLEQQPQSHPEVAHLPQIHTQASSLQTQASLPQAQASLPHYQLQSQAQYNSQSEVVQVQSSQPGASYSHPSQASLPVQASGQPQIHDQLVLPPHPSQVPHPSLSLSTPPIHPTPTTQNKTEAPPAPAQPSQPQPGSPAHPPSQQSHPPHHSHVISAPAPHHQPIPGAVPLQQLSQLYQDPLYPGFPHGEKGDVAPTPAFSSSKSGEDLPRDVNILRFFFNLGVKAYTMPMYPPCVYLLPLQQAYTIHPKLPSRSPSPNPQFPPSNPPTRHQEAYPQYPPMSASVPAQYDHQATLAEPPHSSEPSFNHSGYPVTQPPPQRMPWQQHQMAPPRNSSYPVGYSSTTAPYPVPLASSQAYPTGQGPGHPLYPPPMSSSLAYHPSPTPEELQVSQGSMEQLQPPNGVSMPSHGPSRVPGSLERPAAANVANANSRTMVVPDLNSFALKTEQGESLTKAVLLVDPPLNNTPIVTFVPNSISDVTMTTVMPSCTPGSHDIISTATVPGDNNLSQGFRSSRKPFIPTTKAFIKMGADSSRVGYLQGMALAEPMSVGCSTEDDWEETEAFKHPPQNFRGPRKIYRGPGRGRGGHDGGRGGNRRRHVGEAGSGFNHGLHGSSHRGRGY
ncbi:OTU domain-containing protein 4 isoform X2 [Mastacembelus armatus]|uniref:OTU domain-containing protein 4 isoform X2 n=1 Tax=Mastacembelus armatus TaxID=205130 RepID=UPI000E45480D|nr:OTU domain-containing protein 4 isoform X2 [Mastacembelus armatus]